MPAVDPSADRCCQAPLEMALAERAARRGPVPLPADQRRDHCVSVRVNVAELARLDAVRGRFQRGEWLRMAALDQLPPSVPEANAKAWAELARLAANLNQAQTTMNRGERDSHDLKLIEALAKEVSALRRELVGVRS